MSNVVEYPHVKLVDGQWVIEHTKIPVSRLFFLHKRWSFDVIFERYPGVGRAEVLSAVAFCYDNPEFSK